MRRDTGVTLGAMVAAAVLAVGAPLSGQSVPAGRQIVSLDLAGTPIGEIPKGMRVTRGSLTVVEKDGLHMLKASAEAEFVLTLPEILPAAFTIEFALIPKACCNPVDLSFEGTPAMSRSNVSANVDWSRETVIVVGGGDYYQAAMPAELRPSLPSQLSQIVASADGETLKLYTNGRRLFTLSDRQFARSRVLRVYLGGQDDREQAVYLARLRIAEGPAAAVLAGQADSGAARAVGSAAAPAPAPISVVPPSQPSGSITPMTPPPAAVGPAPGGPGARPTAAAVQPPPPPSTTPILVGTGISDITGPIADVGMMGYGDGNQKTAGLHLRLHARAFIFAAPGGGKRVVFVSTELAMLFSSVKQGVLRKLSALYGNLYDERNVMISATHTHSGPGGFSHHVMYNITTSGHVKQNYDAIVDGITEAVVQAHNRLGTATVSVISGEVVDRTMVNRSIDAFRLNPEARGTPADSVNREMTVLKIQSGGRAVGAIAWFAVHNTSMSKSNRLVSSDHKGYAAYLFEKKFGSIAPLQNYGDFVAAFPNGAEGDMSPNLFPLAPDKLVGPGGNDFESTYLIGQREYDAAQSLFAANQSPVTGDIDFRQKFVMMPGLIVTATTHTNGAGLNFLCPAAYGASFNAGAEDGRPDPPHLPEGLALGSTMSEAGLNAARGLVTGIVGILMPPLLPVVAGVMLGSSDRCQLPKPVLIPTGELRWTPEILPFQLLRVGPLAIAGIPGEMTMQGGRRLRDSLMVALAPLGVQRVVLTGLANEYSGYITTPEEYDSQQYEGASTLYGRLTFDAYQQSFREIASAMVSGQAVIGANSPAPPDLSVPQLELSEGVKRDEVPIGQSFGQVLIQPEIATRGAAEVHVRYRSGHPKNDLRRNNTYVRIEHQVPTSSQFPDGWALVAWDGIPETKLYWSRDPACPEDSCFWSFMDVFWRVPMEAPPGTYRIRFVGSWKNSAGQLARYQGTTSTFSVQ